MTDDAIRAPRSGDRLPALEALRGLASLQVLLLHAFSAFWPAAVFGGAVSVAAQAVHHSPLFLAYDGYAAPYLFFVLSGYVLTPAFAKQVEAPAAALASRWFRLAAPAVAACAVSAVLHALFWPERAAAALDLGSAWLGGGWSPPGTLLHFLADSLVRGTTLGYATAEDFQAAYVAPLWTLSIEFKASILTFVLVVASLQKPPVWRVAVIAAALAFFRSAYLCFVVGHWLAHVDARAILRRWPRPAKAALALAGVGLLLADEAQLLGDALACKTACASHLIALYGALLTFAAFLSSARAERWLSAAPLVALGRLSFPLYLVHWPIVFGIGSWTYLAALPAAGPTAAAAAAALASIGLSLAAAMAFAPVDAFAVAGARRLRQKLASAAPGPGLRPAKAAS